MLLYPKSVLGTLKSLLLNARETRSYVSRRDVVWVSVCVCVSVCVGV